MGVLPELAVPRPVPLLLDRPALPRLPSNAFRLVCRLLMSTKLLVAISMNLLKRIAVTPASAHQLDDPAGAISALRDGVFCIASRKDPTHLARADSKFQQASCWGWRRTMASSAVMSCITAWMPARIDRKPVRRSRFNAAVRRVAMAPAPLPR